PAVGPPAARKQRGRGARDPRALARGDDDPVRRAGTAGALLLRPPARARLRAGAGGRHAACALARTGAVLRQFPRAAAGKRRAHLRGACRHLDAGEGDRACIMNMNTPPPLPAPPAPVAPALAPAIGGVWRLTWHRFT